MQTRLLQHTEVLSHILSFTDRHSLIPCLRVSTDFHAIALLHIDKVYKHITIDRDSIKSVFEGIRWDWIEEKWSDEADRVRRGRGSDAVMNNARQAFRNLALFGGTSWEDMDEGWRNSRDSRCSAPPAYEQPNPIPTPSTFGSTPVDQHSRKVHALSKCTTLTLCDTWTTYGLDTRLHTHNLLHNGKAHQLFPSIETVRVIPVTSAHHTITPLCSARGCCPFIQELSPKKLVQRNVSANGHIWSEGPVDELVLFLPDRQWPVDMEEDYMTESVEDRFAGMRCKIIRLVFGPPLVDNHRSDRHTPFDPSYRPEDRIYGDHVTPDTLINIIRAACAESKMTHIYGLERARMMGLDDWFQNDRPGHKVYCYPELLSLIKWGMSTEREIENSTGFVPVGPFDNYRIHKLHEYVSQYPDDELLEHELDGTENWSWHAARYWTQPWLQRGGRRYE